VTELFRRTLRAGGKQVPLLAGPSALAELRPTLDAQGFSGRLWQIVGDRPFELHGAALEKALPTDARLTIAGDESAKTVATLGRIWDWLVEQGARRGDALVAFGGGAVTDLVGFAAATYMRGIGVVNVPTTLLGQVDASVGGKTGINHPGGKNLIGAFHQPLAVVADTNFLATLPKREFAAGLAEVAKMAFTLDAELFERLEADAAGLSPSNGAQLTPFIGRSIELKAEIVERDEREDGDRMLLNYGHTIGHALEAEGGFGKLLHGEAVAIGMEAAAFLGEEMGVLDRALGDRQRAMVRALGLPVRAPGFDEERTLARLQLDKKRAARLRWILADRLGHATIREDVPEELVRAAVRLVIA
jgi:3-dehydroquinate synthase